MESFSFLLANCTQIVGKIIHMAMQKVYFHTHIAPKHLESLKQAFHQESATLSFGIAKKNWLPPLQMHSMHPALLIALYWWRLDYSTVWGPSNTPALSFPSVMAGNFTHRYLKQSPSLPSAFTNCFMKPNLMYSGGRRTFFGFNNGSYLVDFHHQQTQFVWAMFYPLVFFCTAVPQTRKAGILCASSLLFQKHAHNFQISTNFPVVLWIL